MGLNITIQTTAKTDEHGFELLKSFGMPFRKQQLIKDPYGKKSIN